MTTTTGKEVKNEAVMATGAALQDQASSSQRSLGRSLLAGACSLGTALAVERGASFFSNMLAARFAGPAAFGAYSIAVTTANSIAAYAGAGIGITSTRFVAETPQGAARAAVLRTLLFFGLVSSLLAAILLWLGAASFATHLLHNAKLVRPLQVGSLSAAAFVALEVCRGVFIGMRSFTLLLRLSGTLALGLLIAIPIAAWFGPVSLVVAQFSAILLAVLVGVWSIWRWIASAQRASKCEEQGVSLATVWRFGLVQLGGVISLNAAGWWTALMVARGDSTLLQAALYTVAMQWKNLCILMPNMVQQGNFSFYTDRGASDFGGAARVTALSCILASALIFSCTGVVLVAIPFVLHHFYGNGYASGELATAISLVGAIVQLGSAPASSRLTMLSMRWITLINGIYSAFVIAVGTLFIPKGGAAAAALALFVAYIISAFMVLIALKRERALPRGVTVVVLLDIGIAAAMGLLSWIRVASADYFLATTLLLLGVPSLGVYLLWRIGQHYGILPSGGINVRFMLRSLLAQLQAVCVYRDAG